APCSAWSRWAAFLKSPGERLSPPLARSRQLAVQPLTCLATSRQESPVGCSATDLSLQLSPG
ncbi:hypothetical protein A2U01_0063273, partial [Trifolium medium]|nr:hypothetical protein [Trifolium medium]